MFEKNKYCAPSAIIFTQQEGLCAGTSLKLLKRHAWPSQSPRFSHQKSDAEEPGWRHEVYT